MGKVSVPSTVRKGAERVERVCTNKVGPASVNRALAVAKHAIGLFATWGWISDGKASELRKVKHMKEAAGRVRELSADEEGRILGAVPLRIRQIVEAALLTGCRRAEIVRLRRDAVDMKTREITLTKTKNGKVRQIPISDRLATILDDAMLEPDAGERVYVFEQLGKRHGGHPYSVDSISRAFARAARKLGIKDARFHDTRHSFATRLRRGGVQLDVLKQLGGWSSLTMVGRYAHVDREELHSAVALLGGCHTTSTQQNGETEKLNHLHEVK